MPEFRGLMKKYKEDTAFEETQKELKEKHHIEDKNVVVVEKNNMAKFSIKTLGTLIRLFATIIILALAAVGLTALLYPESREALLSIFQLAADQTSEMIGG